MSKINKKIAELEVQIVKMKESSGNEQFFIRMIRNDSAKKSLFDQPTLEHSCWQTKNLSREECLSRAWWDASYLARFVGLNSMEEVKIIGLEEEEISILKSSLSIFRN